DPRRRLPAGARLGAGQRTQYAAPGVATVESQQVLALGGVSIPPGQIDHQLALGAEDDGRPPLGQGQLRLAEGRQAGHRPGSSGWRRRAPVKTQLWARTVLARLGQRPECSRKVQAPQTSALERWTLVSSPAQTQ